MKRRIIALLCAGCLFSLTACQEDIEITEVPMPPVEEEPEPTPDDTDKIYECEHPLLLTEQAQGRILIVDADTRETLWEWRAASAADMPDATSLMRLPSEGQAIYNRRYILATASGGGVALIRIADKKAMFYAKPGGNPHSAEVLPDGNVVVASSTGNLLSVYVYNGADSYVSRPAFTMPVHSAHNVVWDRKRGCLWTATGAQLLKLAYNGKRTAPELTQVRSYDMAAGNTDAHDLAPVCGEDAMYVSTNQHVYKFDCAAEKFLDVEIFQQNTIKSISTGPEGYSTIVMRPTSGGSNWWSAEVCDMKGNRLFNRAGYQIYKARWYVENPFGYPEVHTL